MGRKAMLALALPVVLVGLLCLALGWRVLSRTPTPDPSPSAKGEAKVK